MRTIVILLAIATLGAAQFYTINRRFRRSYTVTIMPPWWLVGHGIGTLTFAQNDPQSPLALFGTITGLNPNKRHGIWGYNSTNCGYVGSILHRFNNVDPLVDYFTTDNNGVLYLDFDIPIEQQTVQFPRAGLSIVIHEIELKDRLEYTCGILSDHPRSISCCVDPLLILKARLVPWFTCCGQPYH